MLTIAITSTSLEMLARGLLFPRSISLWHNGALGTMSLSDASISVQCGDNLHSLLSLHGKWPSKEWPSATAIEQNLQMLDFQQHVDRQRGEG